MGKSNDAPDPPDYGPIAAASKEAAQYAYQVSREQLDWARERYQLDRDVADSLIQDMRDRSYMQDLWAAEDRQHYETQFRPLEEQIVAEAKGYDTPERRQEEAGKAMASVADQSALARQAAQRNLESFGVDPSSTRYAALDVGSRTQQAAAMAGAGNQAMQNVENVGRAMKADAVNLGRGFQINPLSSSQAALAGNTAAGNLNLGTTASGQAGMGTGAQWSGVGNQALGVWGNALNMGYNNQLAQFNANQNASGTGLGALIGLAGAAGTFFAAEGGEMPSPPPRAAIPVGRGAAAPALTSGLPLPAQVSGAPPSGALPARGPGVPAAAAPDGTAAPGDRVPANLEVGEFVIPRETVEWVGQKSLHDLIAKAQKEKAAPKQAMPTYQMTPPQQPRFMTQGIPA